MRISYHSNKYSLTILGRSKWWNWFEKTNSRSASPQRSSSSCRKKSFVRCTVVRNFACVSYRPHRASGSYVHAVQVHCAFPLSSSHWSSVFGQSNGPQLWVYRMLTFLWFEFFGGDDVVHFAVQSFLVRNISVSILSKNSYFLLSKSHSPFHRPGILSIFWTLNCGSCHRKSKSHNQLKTWSDSEIWPKLTG